jgi:hypothetical protein
MPKPVKSSRGKTYKRSRVNKEQRKRKHKKTKPKYVCKACNDTGVNSKGGPCYACEKRRQEAAIANYLRDRE